MAATTKATGLGDDLLFAGFHPGGDIQSLTINGGNTPLVLTDITQSAFDRRGGLRTGGIHVVAYHDSAASGNTSAHLAFSPLSVADQVITYLHAPAIGSQAACCNAKQINYDPTRGTDGSLTFAVDAESNAFGLEWGIQLTAGLRTDSAATVGPVFDQGAAGPGFGAQAYMHLVAFSGTSVDVAVQHATTSGGSYTNLIDFGAQTTPGSFRGTAAGAVNEFLKVTTTGTFSNAVFAVVFMLNPVAVVF